MKFFLERTKNIHGIVWMVLACFLAAVMISLVRVTSEFVPVGPMVFFRNLFQVVLFLPWLFYVGLGALKTNQPKLFFARGFSALIAMHGWFYAVSVMPLAEATALSFAAPLFSTILAVLFLKERVGIHRVGALLVGFMGVLIVLRPGTETFSIYGLMVVGVTFFWAISGTIIKILTRTETPTMVSFYMALIMTPLSLPGAVITWQPIEGIYPWVLLAALAVFSNLFQLALSTAIARADLTVILPFDFTRLIFVSILGYLFFGEHPDFWTYVGAGVIVASSAYAAYRERVRRHANTS